MNFIEETFPKLTPESKGIWGERDIYFLHDPPVSDWELKEMLKIPRKGKLEIGMEKNCQITKYLKPPNTIKVCQT